jgi:Response regulator receiver domain
MAVDHRVCCVGWGLIDSLGSGQPPVARLHSPQDIAPSLRRKGKFLESTSLAWRIILLVEDEPLIALNIGAAFEKAGAVVVAARSLSDAVRLVEQDSFLTAVLDFGLQDGNAVSLCGRLNDRNIPFVLHSGYGHVGENFMEAS